MPIHLRKAQAIVPKVPKPHFPRVFWRGEENRSGDETNAKLDAEIKTE